MGYTLDDAVEAIGLGRAQMVIFLASGALFAFDAVEVRSRT